MSGIALRKGKLHETRLRAGLTLLLTDLQFHKSSVLAEC